MKTDYITSTPTLPPQLVYPRFLIGMDLRLITKEVYCILLDMVGQRLTQRRFTRLTASNSARAWPTVDGVRSISLAISGLMNVRYRRPCLSTLTSPFSTQPYRTYVKLPAG